MGRKDWPSRWNWLFLASSSLIAATLISCRTEFKDENDELDALRASTKPQTTQSQPNTGTEPPKEVIQTQTTDPRVFTLQPSLVTVVIGTTKTFEATNGSPPYRFEKITGDGSITTGGQYTATDHPGSAMIKATDSLGRVALATITVNPHLTLEPNKKNLVEEAAYRIPVVGGVPPYSYKLDAGSVGALGLDGTFSSLTAGNAKITVTDSSGTLSKMDIKVYEPLSLGTDKSVAMVNTPVQLSVSGGIAPFSYSVTQGEGGINGAGVFSSTSSGPFPAQARVCANDSETNQSCQTLQIVSPISITPSSTEIAIGNTSELVITGGVLPLTFEETTAGAPLGTVGAPCASPGARCRGFVAGTAGTATLRVTDAHGNRNSITIKINPVLSVSPTTISLPPNTPFTFVASGGVKPYTYETPASSGTFTGATLTTPASAPSPFPVTVHDLLGNSAQATVTLSENPDWPGICTVTRVSATSVRVTWLRSPAASSGYLVTWDKQNCVVGPFETCATQSASIPGIDTTSYVVTGLSPGKSYVFGVHINDGGDGGGGGGRTLTELMGAITVSHTGWADVKALGRRVPASGSGLTAVGASVTLAWNPMTTPEVGAHVDGYNIYRSTTPGAGAGLPINTEPITAHVSWGAPFVYTDNWGSLQSRAYYYVVKPIVNGVEVAALNTDHPTEIQVVVPPDNMALVHRWIANQRGCAALGQTSNPNTNYSCAFTWPNGATTYDVSSGTKTGYFIDAVETGCNYSRGSVCKTSGGADIACIEKGPPQALGITATAANSVYYDRLNGNCFIYTNSNWIEAAGASQDNLSYMASNTPGLPPLVLLPQSKAAQACAVVSRALPTRLQQITAAEWDPSVSSISTVETGGGNNCNADNAHAIAFDDKPTPDNLETLPFATGGGTPAGYSLRSGSNATASCVSRFGAQDLVGNVWEWSGDQVFCVSYVSKTIAGESYHCYGTATNLGGVTSDFKNIYIANHNGGGTADRWDLSASQSVFVPLTLPVLSTAGYTSVAPGTLTNLNSSHFKLLGGANYGTRGALTGGAWNGAAPTATGAGRHALDLGRYESTTDVTIGFRCVQQTP